MLGRHGETDGQARESSARGPGGHRAPHSSDRSDGWSPGRGGPRPGCRSVVAVACAAPDRRDVARGRGARREVTAVAVITHSVGRNRTCLTQLRRWVVRSGRPARGRLANGCAGAQTGLSSYLSSLRYRCVHRRGAWRCPAAAVSSRGNMQDLGDFAPPPSWRTTCQASGVSKSKPEGGDSQ